MKKKKTKYQYPAIKVDEAVLEYYAERYIDLHTNGSPIYNYVPSTFASYLEMMIMYKNTMTGFNMRRK